MTQPAIAAALAADRAGDLDQARALIRQLLHQLPYDAPLADRITAFRTEAKVFRHRDDAASIRHAIESATHAVRLTELSGVPVDGRARGLAQLELASCLFATDRFTKGADLAFAWRNHHDSVVSGWAWALLGEGQLGLEQHFQAAAALMNALAEFDRDGNEFRQRTTRIALAAALDRSGRSIEASKLLRADRQFWSGDGTIRRTSIAYLQVRAENQQHLGQLKHALDTLKAAEALLAETTGMQVARVRLCRQFAVCYDAWGQRAEASSYLRLAERLLGAIVAPPTPKQRPPVLAPPPDTVVLRSVDPDQVVDESGVHAQLLGETAAVAVPMVRRLGSNARSALWAQRVADQPALIISRLLADADALFDSRTDVVALLQQQLARLRGVPGAEKQEAICQVEAGVAFQSATDAAARLAAERWLRRALVRMTWLPGMELWQARAQLGLAQLLAADGRDARALELAITGLQALNAERFEMAKRRQRHAWLSHELRTGFELAIELALRCGREQLAADLIIFSRAAGVVVARAPDGVLGELDDVPLRPLPKLVYIDQAESELGSGGVCRFL